MSDRMLEGCLNVDDVRGLAQRRLPAPIFDFIDGGREDEVTLRRNVDDFRSLKILPRVLRNVAKVETAIRVLGCDLSFPLILAPTGGQTFLHPEGELPAARAAARAGILYCLSSFASQTIEAVADVGPGPRMFQLNALVDDRFNSELIQRARDAQFDWLCLTVDNPVTSRAERFERWAFAPGRRPPWRTLLEFARHPVWSFRQRDLAQRAAPYVVRELHRRGLAFGTSLAGLSRTAFRRDLDWEEAARLRRQWDGPFLLKGILSVEDAKQAVRIGADGIVVCNHGGYALDGAPSSISVLGRIADAVGDDAVILLGSGIRRGTSMVKSLALGAEAVIAGRAFLYGLAAAGEAGVAHVIELLRAEFTTALAAAGCVRPDQLDEHFVTV